MQRNTMQRLPYTRTLIFKKRFYATSYIIATFHPTIGQCTHQYLSDIASPELGMISYRNKGTLANSYIAKGAITLNQANTVGFIRMQGKTHQHMGFIGHSAKPSQSWISQIEHSQSNLHF